MISIPYFGRIDHSVAQNTIKTNNDMRKRAPLIAALLVGISLSWLVSLFSSSSQRLAIAYIETYDVFLIAVASEEPYRACLEFGESRLFGIGLAANEMRFSLSYQSGKTDTILFLTDAIRTKSGVPFEVVKLEGKNICEDRNAGEAFVASTGSGSSKWSNFVQVREGF